MGEFSAICLAAGQSSRMGEFKPIIPIGGKPAICHCIDTLSQSGVTNIIVVSGYKADVLTECLHGKNVKIVHNNEYSQGMLSSAKLGAMQISSIVDGFFIVLADIPLFESETVTRLIEHFDPQNMQALSPSVNMRAGHPTLCAASIAEKIVNYDGVSLKDLFRTLNRSYISVQDYGTILDMDTPDDYMRLVRYYKQKHYSMKG